MNTDEDEKKKNNNDKSKLLVGSGYLQRLVVYGLSRICKRLDQLSTYSKSIIEDLDLDEETKRVIESSHLTRFAIASITFICSPKVKRKVPAQQMVDLGQLEMTNISKLIEIQLATSIPLPPVVLELSKDDCDSHYINLYKITMAVMIRTIKKIRDTNADYSKLAVHLTILLRQLDIGNHKDLIVIILILLKWMIKNERSSGERVSLEGLDNEFFQLLFEKYLILNDEDKDEDKQSSKKYILYHTFNLLKSIIKIPTFKRLVCDWNQPTFQLLAFMHQKYVKVYELQQQQQQDQQPPPPPPPLSSQSARSSPPLLMVLEKVVSQLLGFHQDIPYDLWERLSDLALVPYTLSGKFTLTKATRKALLYLVTYSWDTTTVMHRNHYQIIQIIKDWLSPIDKTTTYGSLLVMQIFSVNNSSAFIQNLHQHFITQVPLILKQNPDSLAMIENILNVLYSIVKMQNNNLLRATIPILAPVIASIQGFSSKQFFCLNDIIQIYLESNDREIAMAGIQVGFIGLMVERKIKIPYLHQSDPSLRTLMKYHFVEAQFSGGFTLESIRTIPLSLQRDIDNLIFINHSF
ncbi:hypothetical protein DFA_00424 [Cavenderia fasciculata]|uniref:Uncharacterized protein n=1 Tax=Cavenderia fasciculata TaxID=261658 RepID=F4PRR4_CACFS|nr:uncharacterized protein DFA_00424 [Cavenderia fasciculata]EGG20563.1 hypothetical protein DFA_00424 [Cavenderia fasciculata]|eukprot:XP_004358413.1 hypothetical protein DFA_00424 [Cavenderia fasciculata]